MAVGVSVCSFGLLECNLGKNIESPTGTVPRPITTTACVPSAGYQGSQSFEAAAQKYERNMKFKIVHPWAAVYFLNCTVYSMDFFSSMLLFID
jgi:hypothetical protein